MNQTELKQFLSYLTPTEQLELNRLILDYQKPIWEPFPGPQTMAMESQADILGFGGSAGGGKVGLLTTPRNASIMGLDPQSQLEEFAMMYSHKVLTPFGFKLLDQILVGDAVCNPDGTTTEVVIVHPPRQEVCYELVFVDGAKCIVGENHLWAVKVSGQRNRRKLEDPYLTTSDMTPEQRFNTELCRRYKVITTNEMVRLHDRAIVDEQSNQRPRWISIPLCEPVNTQQSIGRTDMMPPYTMGVLLGDGHFGATVSWTKSDQFIAEEISRELVEYDFGDTVSPRSDGMSFGIVGGHALNSIRSLGLDQKRAGTKFVPTQYKSGPISTRTRILQGLMDTDGYVDERGQCYFTTISPQLANDVQYLARSLGFTATITEKENTFYEYKGEQRQGQLAYNIYITGRDRASLFCLPRKKDRTTEILTEGGRRLVGYRKIPEPMDSRCITVSHPNGLYLTNDFIVTHNSDLLLGVPLLNHTKAIIFRREAIQSRGMMDRLTEIVGATGRLNENFGIWRDGRRQIQFAGVKDVGDEQRWKGRAHDYCGFDEADAFLESQIRFLLGWMRTTIPNQRCRAILCFNPPSNPEGRWIIDFFGPWINKKHPKPAMPGELRWYATLPGEEQEIECKDSSPFEVYNERLKKNETIQPLSRTFVPSRVTDNPALMRTNYIQTLMQQPEPRRSQLLYGDMEAGIKDDPYQIIPTAWVDAAMGRWKPETEFTLTAIGVDPSRGGTDATTISRRHRTWFAKLISLRGEEVDDGPKVCAAVMEAIDGRPNVEINIDVIGIGASAYDSLVSIGSEQFKVIPINFAESAPGMDRENVLYFVNMRSWAYWSLREALDPTKGDNLALPPDRELLIDLTAPRWMMRPGGIIVESKDELKKRLRRSPDKGDAVVMANIIIPGLEYTGALIG